MSIAIRFIPTLLEESDKIIKAQTSRGVDFKHGKYLEKTKAMVSIVVPLFVSCFEKSEDLSEAMLVKGYGMGKRSEYKREAHKVINIFSIIACASIIALCFVLNGVI
jgi:energy-coupling factor transport system permease protein